ncbi:MAG: DegQ family serine endoprotease [Desulfobacterales bacterium]
MKHKLTPLLTFGIAFILCMTVSAIPMGTGDPVVITAAVAQVRPDPGSFSSLVKEVGESVVNISAVKVVASQNIPESPFGPGDPFNEFFERFFGDQMPREFKQRSLGSGFIIDSEGLIITNSHVVRKTTEIEVTLSDGRNFDAEIVGMDELTDLALIRINAEEKLPEVPLGNSEKVEVGDWVVAIGSPFGLGNTVTAGIVSAKYRRIGTSAYEDFIQTDASINPGNSGGPLLNIDGEVIGINTAIFSRSGGNIGIGFAVPIDTAKSILPQLKKGKVVRGWLGVLIQEITPEIRQKLNLEAGKGALVSDVTEGGPADKAGIRRGDVIKSFAGTEIEEMADLPKVVANTEVGKRVEVEMIRDGTSRQVTVEVGELETETERAGRTQKDRETPRLGMGVQDVTPELAARFNLPVSSGVAVLQVVPGSPAAEAGLRVGDVIVEAEQDPVRSVDDLLEKVKKLESGEHILLLVNRDGNTQYRTLQIQ